MGKGRPKKTIAQYLEILKNGPEPELRATAARALGRRGDAQAAGPLIEALRDSDSRVIAAAAGSLGDLQAPAACDPLLALLGSDTPSVRTAAIGSLGKIRDRKAIPLLIGLLDDREVADLAESSLSCYGAEAVDPLLEKFSSDRKETRARVSRILAGFANRVPESIKDTQEPGAAPLRQLVLAALLVKIQSPDPVVRRCAAESLGLLHARSPRAPSAEDTKDLKRAADSLMTATADPQAGVRKAAVDALGRIGAILRPAMKTGRQANGEKKKKEKAPALADHVSDHLARALDDPSYPVRLSAGKALGSMRSSRSSASLFTTLRNKGSPGRSQAADGLMQVSARAGADTIVRALRDPHPDTRRITARSISRFLESSKTGNRQRSGWFRPCAATATMKGMEPARKISAALLENADHPDESVRKSSLDALASLHDAIRETRTGEKSDICGAELPAEPTAAVPETEVEKQVRAKLEAASAADSRPRYADPAFYSDYPDDKKPVPEGQRLVADTWYGLRVSVRREPEGIPSADGKREAIREPRRDHPVTLIVTAEGDGFEIEEPVTTLVLPPSGDTAEPARFRVRPLEKTVDPRALAAIRLNLYYAFFLLAVVTVEAEVVGKFDDPAPSAPGLKNPITLRENRLTQDVPDFDHMVPRDMNIKIRKTGNSLLFRFILGNGTDGKIIFPAPVRLDTADLEDLLNTTRTCLAGIAMDETFATQLEGDPSVYKKILRELAGIGRDLWTKLFLQKKDSALSVVGKWLKENPLPDNSLIQVSFEDRESNFVFPWALLYDRPLPEDDYSVPDVMGFWGMRYCIEQMVYGIRHDGDTEIHPVPDLRIGFMLWDQFSNADDQVKMFQSFAEKGLAPIRVSQPPIDDADECHALLKDCPCHILYFYAHGFTRQKRTTPGPDMDLQPFLRFFQTLYDSLKDDDPRKEPLRSQYESIKKGQFETRRSWIELTYKKLYLNALYGDDLPKLPMKPIVFLNLCESAQILPTLSDSFIDYFIQQGALCVIGTECPMTIQFAHPFSEKFFQEFLSGESVGMAALRARRFFLKVNNPLGLAYTLFGSSTLRFDKPLISPETAPVHKDKQSEGNAM